MTEPVLRPPPAPLIPNNPTCGVCHNITEESPGGWRCDACAAWWTFDSSDGPGFWNYPDDPRCPSVDGRYLPGGAWAASSPESVGEQPHHCELTAGHVTTGIPDHVANDAGTGRHWAWTDDDEATTDQLLAVVEAATR